MTSLWLGLRARITSPTNPYAGRIGVVVAEPNAAQHIVVRFEDGSHILIGAWSVKIERAAEGIEPT